MPSERRGPPPGFTLVELVLVLLISSLITMAGLRQLGRYLDREATRNAVRSAGSVISRARDEAIALHTPVSVRIDTGLAVMVLSARGRTFDRTPLRETYGVTIASTRDSITFDVRGLGYGAANLTLVARRGSSADTLTVSRLGRIRF